MISVCMACYNGEKYIGEQLRSILEQLGDHDEVIISDDGSSDSTIEIIRSFRDPRIRILSNPGPDHGVNANFNNALSNARGDIIFLSDQDDVWLPGKVKACMEALQRSGCVVHDAFITYGNLNITSDSFFKDFNCRSGFIHNWIRNGYLGCAMAFRRDILDIALPIPEHLPVFQDIWIGSLCAVKSNVEFIPFKGIKFRRHSSTSSITSKHSFPLSKKISYRLSLLGYLFKRIYLHS